MHSLQPTKSAAILLPLKAGKSNQLIKRCFRDNLLRRSKKERIPDHSYTCYVLGQNQILAKKEFGVRVRNLIIYICEQHWQTMALARPL